MSSPVTPADYFQPVLASARLQNELTDELTATDLRLKVAENLRINFLRLFQSNTVTDIPEPASITTSQDNVERVHSLLSHLHDRYYDLLNKPHVFNYLLDDDDLVLVDEFRSGEAMRFLTETLTPYLADLAERGICTEDVLQEKYNEFLGISSATDTIAAEEFWDSPAVMFYTSHMTYKDAAEKLRMDNEETPVSWFEEQRNSEDNQLDMINNPDSSNLQRPSI
ncbi:hypothetical protein [Citrobacter amalonaticus]|uniref:hypothetical protein n=1 Tax=Citrobacter amalonaticus TaxID=35703 RepID=UPI000F67C74B|nr:hypothetical protein [Citrobacter amalonaticus]RSC52113.1 hypothetical protein EGW07_25510 [Citrobacter amalonaticus]